MRARALGGALATVACLTASVTATAQAASPRGWPKTFQLGVSSQPDTARAVRSKAPFGFRYQYLPGGVNTGTDWSTYNPDGTFVSRYVRESRRAHITPVFTYYTLLQSKPAVGAEDVQDRAHLRSTEVMRAYWRNVRLALTRMKGGGRVVMHIEPDLWGYIQQASRGDRASTVPAAVASTGDPALAGLPNDAAGFAQAFVRLRDRIAPNVTLAYHLSIFGTREDITYSKPSRAHIATLARRSARFYRSLHARFDIVFNDVADRDAGYRQTVLGDGGRSVWKAADFHRHAAFIHTFTRTTNRKVVIWQIPLGNSKLPDTRRRYRDNRVEWWLGRHRSAHLREARHAGIVALMFGAGNDETTTQDTDGGLFYRLARGYYRHPLR